MTELEKLSTVKEPRKILGTTQETPLSTAKG